MGKNKKVNSLGRSLVKDKFSHGKRFTPDRSMLHTTELQDGYDWGRLNLQSVTEESSLQEFLSTAELAGTEFSAEKLNIKFVNPKLNIGLLSAEEKARVIREFNENKDVVKIPRRPSWNVGMSAEELKQRERDEFLEWRRALAILQEEKGFLLTPYEKNLEFWRQLWRVIERSDVIVQIVDARNPLLFRCEDLEKYVAEVSENKTNLILLNKADFLTEEQRRHWANYFDSLNIPFAFFSAVLEEDLLTIEELKEEITNLEAAVDKTEAKLDKVLQNLTQSIPTFTETASATNTGVETRQTNCSTKILSRTELIQFFSNIHHAPKVSSGITTIGLVGYPNVGKSSTINSLLTVKKVSVSATPGKTKHFQTLYLNKELLLCDCPGLVMPSLVFSKADMVVNGILPIDQMRDHVPPITLVSSLIPRHVIEDTYSIMLPKPMATEDENRCPTSEELLNTYGFCRGFMTANGQPDNPRAARYILKDFINGKLLYAHAPPDVPQHEFMKWNPKKPRASNREQTPREKRAARGSQTTLNEVNKDYFQSGAHTKGVSLVATGLTADSQKPWRQIKKREIKKKEKVRRLYAHLDQH